MLDIVTYNTYKERNGQDPVLDAVLREPRTLVCLQEVCVSRAWDIKRSHKAHSFVTPLRLKYGLQFLAVVLPQGARFVERRTIHLTSHWGLVPNALGLRRSYQLYRSGSRRWRNALTPYAAQIGLVLWERQAFLLVNTHIPWETGLRPRSLDKLRGLLVGEQDILLVGDLNATTKDVFLADLMKATGLRSMGPTTDPLHRRRNIIDHVLFLGTGLREVGSSLEDGLSDHPLVRVTLEKAK